MHFGSKFFKTLEALVFKPGFLSFQYKKGNRNDYLNPAAMYLFIAAIFFLVFFAGFRNQKIYFGAIKGKDIVRNGTLKLLKH